MAGPLLYDMVRETTTTTGTGALTLAGAEVGYRSFSVVGDGNTCFYTARHQSADEWEVGIGTYTSSGTTLARTTVLASSNGGAAVNFSAGTKDVILSAPAALLGVNGLTAATPAAEDEIAIYDISAAAVRKATVGDVGGWWKRLSTATASSSAAVDFSLPAGYVAYKVVLSYVAPATDGAAIWMRTSSNGGSSYDAGASDYAWAHSGVNSSGAGADSGDAADAQIEFASNVGNAAGEELSADVFLYRPSAANQTAVEFKAQMKTSAGLYYFRQGVGHRLAGADVDAIRFLFSSGNIASGQFDLYGLAT